MQKVGGRQEAGDKYPGDKDSSLIELVPIVFVKCFSLYNVM